MAENRGFGNFDTFLEAALQKYEEIEKSMENAEESAEKFREFFDILYS